MKGWERFKKKHRELEALRKKNPDVLEYLLTDKNVFLVPADPMNIGMAITYHKNVGYGICQFIMPMDIVDEEDIDLVDDKEVYINLVGGIKELENMDMIVKMYMDRSTANGEVLTIPFGSGILCCPGDALEDTKLIKKYYQDAFGHGGDEDCCDAICEYVEYIKNAVGKPDI